MHHSKSQEIMLYEKLDIHILFSSSNMLRVKSTKSRLKQWIHKTGAEGFS